MRSEDACWTALAAKIRVLYGQRLRGEDYHNLLNRRSVPEIASYLKNHTAYAPALAGIDEHSIHRGQLENLLRGQAFAEYLRLFHYIPDKHDTFFRFLLQQEEVEQILLAVSLLNANLPSDYIFSLPPYLAEYVSFDLYKIPNCKSFDQLLAVLHGTPYEELLRRVRPGPDGKTDLLKLEARLWTFYFSRIFRAVDREFRGSQRDSLRRCFGIQADLYNLRNILRMRRNFGISGDRLRAIVIPYGYKLRPATISNLLTAPVDDSMTLMTSTPYASVFRRFNFAYWEEYGMELKYEMFRFILRSASSPAAAVTAYLELRQIELDNLVSLIEGVRYSLPGAEISRLLVGVSAPDQAY